MISAMCSATLCECAAASGVGDGRMGSAEMVILTFGLNSRIVFEFPADYSMQEGVVLVTGGARRIGSIIARAIHESGARVVLHCNKSRTDADDLCEEFNAARPDSCVVVQGDLL